MNDNHWADYPNIDPNDPRFVRLFVLPKNASLGSGNTNWPIVQIINFYVTGFGANTAAAGTCRSPSGHDDPAALGVFVGHVVP